MVVQRRLDGSYSTNSASPEPNYARIAGRGRLQTRRPGRPPERQWGVGCPACIETVILRQSHLRRVMARASASVVADRSWGQTPTSRCGHSKGPGQFASYDRGRPHPALKASTPTEAYNKGMLLETLAKPQHPSHAPLPAQREHEDVLNGTLAARPIIWNTPYLCRLPVQQTGTTSQGRVGGGSGDTKKLAPVTR